MFATQLIKQLSSSATFARGLSYYREGRLRTLIKREQTYQGEITGSRPYYTQISIESGEVLAYCTCPYRKENWCKHLVATALGIQEEAYEEIPNQSIGLEPLSGFMSKHVREARHFHTFGFLEQLMAKNPHLQAEFLRYVRALPGPLVDIPQTAEDWTAFISEKNDEFQFQVEGKCLLPLLEALEFGQYDTAGQYWLAAYEAYLHSQDAQARYKVQSLSSLMATHLEDALRESILPPPLAKRLIELIFSRWDYFQQWGPPSYQWSEVAWLLELLCADMVSAQFVQHKITAYSLNDPFLTPVKEKIGEILG